MLARKISCTIEWRTGLCLFSTRQKRDRFRPWGARKVHRYLILERSLMVAPATMKLPYPR